MEDMLSLLGSSGKVGVVGVAETHTHTHTIGVKHTSTYAHSCALS